MSLGDKYALLVAVEKYQQRSIPNVQYAEDDAQALSAALELHGFDKNKQEILINNQATKNTIESKLRRILGVLTEEDTFYFYYAGHGFSKNDQNFITCHDSQQGDLERTSISLNSVFNQFKSTRCKKIVMFLDSCEAGKLTSPETRSIFTHMNESEIEDFFQNSEHRVCFAACKADESSHSSGVLKHGVWTHHILEALSGNATMVYNNGLITATNLQNYLKFEVPRTLRKVFSDPVIQTPWFYGAMSNDFLIGDVSKILEMRAIEAQKKLTTEKPPKGRLVSIESKLVKLLDGFGDSHTVPKDANSTTKRFVQGCAIPNIEQELEQMWQACRKKFGYKRNDNLGQSVSDGMGTLLVPDFKFTIEVNQDEVDPKYAIIRRCVDELSDPTLLLDPKFNDIFAGKFDIIEADFSKKQSIENVIDTIENLQSEEISVEYPSDCSYCTIHIESEDVSVTVYPTSYQFNSKKKLTPQGLVARIQAFQKAIIALPYEKPLLVFSD